MLKRTRWLPSEMGAELAKNGRIHGDACGLAMRFTRNPCDHCLMWARLQLLLLSFSQEPVELQKSELGPCIAVAQVLLKTRKSWSSPENRLWNCAFIPERAGSLLSVDVTPPARTPK